MKKQSLICSSLLALALTILVSASALAQAYSPIRITGLVTDFKPADCGKSGSITIAGVTFPIAAGAVVAFRDGPVLVDGPTILGVSGGLVPAFVTSEVWQVMGNSLTNQPPTVRTLNAYLDPQGRIRLQLGQNSVSGALNSLPITSASRPFEITGVVGAVSPTTVTINGFTFQIAAVPSLVAGPSVVRIRGTMNATNQITGVLIPAYTPTTFPLLAPTDFRSVGVGLTGDVNPFDADGPIANAPFIYNPIGTAAGEFLCDQSVERITLEGQASLFFAPNFTMRSLISKDVATNFTFQLDQFNWIVGGTATRP